MPSNLKSLASKKHVKQFIEGAEGAGKSPQGKDAEELVRLNVAIRPELRQELKMLAAQHGVSIRDLVTESLEATVAKLRK